MPVSSAATDDAHPAGRDINITWWYTFLSIAGISVFLLAVAAFVVITLITILDGAAWQVVVVLGLFLANAVACVYATWLLRDGYGLGWPRRQVTSWLLAIPAVTWVVTLFIPGATLYGASPLWMMLSILLPLVRRPHRLGLVVIGLALLTLHALLNPGTAEFAQRDLLFSMIWLVLFPPTTFLVSGWLWDLIRRLDDARTVGSQLAVARERLRFASDLHDIQGHHLQVIALKAELADRLLASGEPEQQQAAQDAIAEIRALAEQAQTETRQLVRDLRVVSLGDELDNAKGVLEAAGMTTEVIIKPPQIHSADTASNRLLGFAVREATTNILRHSNAHHVSIVLHDDGGGLHLEICNDGATPAADLPGRIPGTGLDGLQHRFRAAGGHINSGQQTDTFWLKAFIPRTVEESEL